MQLKQTLLVAPISMVFLLVVTMAACEDTTDKNSALLLGDWTLVQGFRNNKETESLQGTTFHFADDGKMDTNLPIGIETPAPYEVSKDMIEQIGRQTVKYKIQQISDSTLTLGMELRGTEFKMIFRKYVPVQDSI